MVSTYGTWLRGDPRGWRSRHHREHVEGDYRNPPPAGKYDALFEWSKKLMNRDPVHIREELRGLIVSESVARLRRGGIEVIVVSFDDHHLHALLRARDHNPRHWVGLAKKHTSLLLRQLGLSPNPTGGIWAKRCKAKPVGDRAHQLNATRYILDHEKRGAAVWALAPIRTRRPLAVPPIPPHDC
jgi:hypothetical protein